MVTYKFVQPFETGLGCCPFMGTGATDDQKFASVNDGLLVALGVLLVGGIFAVGYSTARREEPAKGLGRCGF